MNEFDLIKRYLEKSGSYKVINVAYYNEGVELPAGRLYMGAIAGIPFRYAFCFGNISISCQLSGVVNIADANELELYVATEFPGYVEPGVIYTRMAVGAGINPMGDGRYLGERRLYGVGFNRLDLVETDCGAANIEYRFNFNGYIFRLK